MSTVLFTGTATCVGGRNGHSQTSDGSVSVDLGMPKNGALEAGKTTPEHLFATGYAACFGSAVELVGHQKKLDVTGAAVTVAVSLVKGDDGFSLAAKLSLKAPALTPEQTKEVLEAAHQVCPYSKATRGNIPVELAS
ncbi:Ohr family peroxiredoxin [Ancylobacter mangrovi]|uniref:Ohr family peroxiredoxin n=1 Tax=Ancylobacter mangrovi TaxID=2972472 RepID=A0A9X2PCM3_9HYPH|nr:Ohr family peroxiredoxin [Ancylobacter mangrovi]MCS0494989.1 Ohr family peroxiredoxin [Ancylobacter mangrovi]MCS0502382.1 Ohr family peroxiredoxin [Ancylobacter mangrovi]